jgi:hypothetical protein
MVCSEHAFFHPSVLALLAQFPAGEKIKVAKNKFSILS